MLQLNHVLGLHFLLSMRILLLHMCPYLFQDLDNNKCLLSEEIPPMDNAMVLLKKKIGKKKTNLPFQRLLVANVFRNAIKIRIYIFSPSNNFKEKDDTFILNIHYYYLSILFTIMLFLYV